MTGLSYINWRAMSDKALMQQIGEFVKQKRLQQNKTQNQLSHAAGISRSTLSLLERGETVTLSTFIQVLRVLDLLPLLESFRYHAEVSPLALAREQAARYRTRGSRKNKPPKSDW